MTLFTSDSELKAVLTHAFSWAVWLRKLQYDALVNEDADAAFRLGRLSENAYIDTMALAQSAGIDMPPMPGIDEDGSPIIGANPFGV